MTILPVTLNAPLAQWAVSLERLEVVLLDRLEGVHEEQLFAKWPDDLLQLYDKWSPWGSGGGSEREK